MAAVGVERVLNYGAGPPEDGKPRRVDTCLDCGGERWEILVVPDTFYCDECEKATAGPNSEVKVVEPEPGTLFDDTAASPTSSGEGYLIDLDPGPEEAPPQEEP